MNGESPVNVVRALLGAAATLFVHCVAGFVVLVILVSVGPVYMRFYSEWNMDLPLMTQQILSVSHFAVCYWYLLFLLLVLDAAIVLVLHLLPQRGRWLKTCWNTAVLLAVILFLGYTALALALPIRPLTIT